MFKNTIAAILFSLLFIGYAEAQKVTPCGYKIPPRSLRTNFSSVYEARDIVNQMLDDIQWKENFTLREQNGIQNAYATISGGRRLIVYDNNFLEDIDAYAKTKLASQSVIAHEMGHHYFNHVVSMQGSTVPSEIEADAFSGFIMQKMGATLEQALAAMNAIGTDQATATHPAKRDRLAAITRGWYNSKANLSPSSANAVNSSTPTTPQPVPQVPIPANPNTPVNPNTTQTSADTDPSWIALYIQSTKDETVQLSDDGKKYQAATIKAGQPFVFKFEIYQYGFLRLPYYNGYRTYKLLHGKDYSILYNRRNKNWVVVEVPE